MKLSLQDQQLIFDLKHYSDLREELDRLEDLLKNCCAGSDTYNALSAACRGLADRISEVERRVLSLTPLQRKLLIERFFEGKAWNVVSGDIGYTEDYTRGRLLKMCIKGYLKA